MAQQLKRENGLMSLRVNLEFWREESAVKFSFEYGAEVIGSWNYPASDIGIPAKASLESPSLNIPAMVLQNVVAMSDGLATAGPDEPLWLHLVPPYGYAGILTWEQVLGAATSRPILRLPDFLERPQEDPQTLEIAVLYDPVSANPQVPDLTRWMDTADREVSGLLNAILGAPRERVIVHLFTTADPSRLFRGWRDRRVQVHDPRSAPTRRDFSTPGRGGSLWLDWISSALDGRTIDALHFICGAEISQECATLLLRDSPSPASERPVVSTIQPGELAAFMKRTGAWAAMFSPPPSPLSDAAWRYFADFLAQMRPGPSLFLDLDAGEPREGAPVTEAYRFLFSPEPSAPPRLGPNFLYCQPSLVAAYRGEQPSLESAPAVQEWQFGRAVGKLAQSIGLAPRLAEPPGWASVAQRYVEQGLLDAKRLQTSLDLNTLDTIQRTAMSTAHDAISTTLGEIQSIINEQTKSRSGGD